jgi:hypothetical protein
MATAKARQRRFNLVLMNATVVLAWYFQRTKLRDDHRWLITLPIMLAVVNGIAFVGTVSRSPREVQSDSAYQAFRFPWRTDAAICSAIGLFFGWVCIERYHDPFLAILPLIVIASGFAECRRKIVIAESEIVYTPPIGSAQRIDLTDVESIESGQVVDFFLLVGRRFWPAAKFTLSNGLTVSIPLGKTGYEQVFDAIVDRWKSNRGDNRKSGTSSTDIASDLH